MSNQFYDHRRGRFREERESNGSPGNTFADARRRRPPYLSHATLAQLCGIASVAGRLARVFTPEGVQLKD
jgi:hypothetical protein